MSRLGAWLAGIRPGSTLANVLTLMTGTTVAQALILAAAPILARLYTPAEFGVFALYTTIVGFMAIVVAGKYDLAILLPEDNEAAANLVGLCLLITAVIGCLTGLLLALGGPMLLSFFNVPMGFWIWLVPLAVVSNGIYATLTAWNNRQRRYRQIAVNRAVQSGLIVASQLTLSIRAGSDGLVIGSFVGYLLTALWWLISTWWHDAATLRRWSWAGLNRQARQHIGMPRYSIATDLLSYVIFQMPVFLLSRYFGAAAVGYYGLTQRVLGVPMVFISNSIGEVFRQQASQHYARTGQCTDMFRRTLKHLLWLSVVPSVVLLSWAPDLFSYAFGEPWREAGLYAQILLPMFFLKFITNPVSYIFMIAGRLRLDLLLHLAMLVILATALVVGMNVWHSAYATLGIFSVAYSFMYLAYLVLSHRFAQGQQPVN